jgi:MFS family permease
MQSTLKTYYEWRRVLSEAPEAAGMCAAQALRYDLVFMLGLLSLFFSMPLHGWIMDRFGARLSNAIGGCFIMLGLLIMAFGYHTTTLDMLVPGLILYASGGAAVALAMFPLARIKQEYISIILAIYNGGFDSGPVVFYLYVKIYQAFGMTPKTFFLSFCAVPILAIILSIFWPKRCGEPVVNEPKDQPSEFGDDSKSVELRVSVSDQTESSDSSNDSTVDKDQMQVELDLESDIPKPNVAGITSSAVALDAIGDSEVMLEAETVASAGETSELGPTDLYKLPFWEQFKSRASMMTCFWNTVFSFWLSSYMGSIQSRLNGIEKVTEETPAKIDKYTEAFGLVLSLAFILGPFLGVAIHKLKLVRSVFVSVILGVIWCLCQFLPSIQLQLITFIVFAVVRAWYYSIAFNVVSQIFGWANVGRMWGTYSAISGVIAIGFYGISWSVVHWLHGSYTIPNLFATATVGSTLIFAFYLQQRKANWELAQLTSPAEPALSAPS